MDNTTFYLSIYQLMKIWVVSPWVLGVMNTAENVHVQIFVWTYVFISQLPM